MLTDFFADFFTDPAAWEVFASGQAEGKLTVAKGPTGEPGLQLDYDFHGGGGFVVARKQVSFVLPETFEIQFALRGEGPPNHFEFKIADPSGANAWRYLRQDFLFPGNWTDLHINERDLPFAWGPAGGGSPNRVGAVELVPVLLLMIPAGNLADRMARRNLAIYAQMVMFCAALGLMLAAVSAAPTWEIYAMIGWWVCRARSQLRRSAPSFRNC